MEAGIKRINPATRQAGFTLLEVLVALFVAGILAFVCCSALITSLKAERQAGLMRQAALLLNQVAADTYLNQEIKDLDPDWEISSESLEQEVEPKVISWHIVRLSPKKNPSLVIETAFRSTD